MTEVTRVPIQPIAKGSLTKLWIALAVVVLIGAGLAWTAMPKGVEVTTITPGTGPNPGPTDVIFVNYVGKLEDGTVFDESQPIPLPLEGIFPDGNPLPLSRMVPGFSEGAQQMQKGGKYELHIPSDKGYGAQPPEGAPIPPNSDLVFEVELVDFMSEEDFQRRVAVLQQMMQQGAPGQEGAPGSAPPQPGAQPQPQPQPEPQPIPAPQN